MQVLERSAAWVSKDSIIDSQTTLVFSLTLQADDLKRFAGCAVCGLHVPVRAVFLGVTPIHSRQDIYEPASTVDISLLVLAGMDFCFKQTNN